MAKRKTAAKSTPVESLKHTKDTRTNIPTREQGGLVADEEATPKKILYPRDPSLDPQLVWKGKDEQDAKPLEVPAVPIYIQEKIHPQALVEDIRERAAQTRRADAAPLATLFDDFNGADWDHAKRTEFYQHDKHWTNRLILGDSLLVMTSLAEKERLKGRVQMIYLDPPYGIKFGSNWQVSTKKRDVKDAKAEDLTRQPEQVKAFRDTWQLGIHSYLTYLRDRLTVARDLLTDSGSIFVQIGDENVHLVRGLMDEVFGSENFVSLITIAKTAGASSELLAGISDYLLWYARNKEQVKYRQLYREKQLAEDGVGEYKYLLFPDGTTRPMTTEEQDKPPLVPQDAELYRPTQTTSQRPPGSDPFIFQGRTFTPGRAQFWKTDIEGLTKLGWAKRLQARDKSISYIRMFRDFPFIPHTNLWADTRWGFDATEKRYVVETNTKVVARCLLMTTDPGDLVLDPTCGSGTTAYVAEQWGRRWMTIDTSRVALALARTRLMAARYPYYLLADSPAGRQKEAELNLSPQPPLRSGEGETNSLSSPPSLSGKGVGGLGYDIRKGFVYKRVPHVTLKSIANNPDIKEGMRRAEIDAAIKKHAETEILYDQPYEDKSVVRVSGPFTVESLSPHRMLPTGEDDAHRRDAGATRLGPTEDPSSGSSGTGVPPVNSPSDFVTTILDNLRKAGVQNTKKGERLTFERLDPYPGEYLQAEGTYLEAGEEKSGTEKGGTGASEGGTGVPPVRTGGTPVPPKTKRVAVCIGPEFGTVGPELVTKAALEACRGLPFDLMLLCGFAFDPHVAEDCLVVEKRAGKMRVLLVRMNPDLSMGDELLKKTGAGNLFMVFGEPDIELKKQKDGKVTVEVKGVDVFDPTTGEIRSSGADDIACWFIDTDYNGESFFVRHAYFLGGQEPYEKLKRALRAEIDEAEWSKLYSARSVPFDPPKKGRIAVKVINHYGDEVLKTYRA